MDETEDINRLIRELNDDRPGSGAIAGEPSDAVRLDRWLEELVQRAGSDLLLVAGAPPCRAHRRQHRRRSPEPPLSGEEIEEAVLPGARRATPAPSTARTGSPTPRTGSAGVGRFRINLHRERGRAAATVRALPDAAAAPRVARPAAGRRGADAPAARPRPRRRPDRLRQDHDARRARRGDQPPRRAAHRHDRGPDRVRAPAPLEPRRADRDRRRRPGLPDRAARGACARRRTSSSSARCATRRRCASRSPRRRPATSSSRRSTRPTSPRRSRASPTPFRPSGRTRSGRSSRWRSPPS